MTETFSDMLEALEYSRDKTTKREAGEVLAHGGWAVFPLPHDAKFDSRLSYLNATIDPGRFSEMADDVMTRHGCADVNIAIVPGRCLVPLIAIDLDGADAITRFFDAATAANHTDVADWLRVNTTRPDQGRHVYFASPTGRAYSNSSHVWGGEVRSGRGHVVAPPSTTAQGTYTWQGSRLYVAPEWVMAGLRATVASHEAGAAAREVTDEEIDLLLDRMSAFGTDAYGSAVLDALCRELAESSSRAGQPAVGRNATLARVTNRIMDLCLEGRLSATHALGSLTATYVNLFTLDERRSRTPEAEVVRCIRSWSRNKDGLEEALAETESFYELARTWRR